MRINFTAALPLLLLASCVTDQTGMGSGYNSYYPSSSSSSYAGGGGQSYGSARPVHISDASWRAPDGRQCDARRAVQRQCDGQASCRIEADNDLCGDPAKGVGKKLVIGYKCGDGRVEVSVQEHKSVTLSCPR